MFLSSGIIKNPDYTTNLLIEAITDLRRKYKFNGYIHVKAIPGTSEILLKKLGALVDRMSANIELPTQNGLKLLAPNKDENKVTKIMSYVKKNRSRSYVPAGQSTQMIIGATKETDLDILNKSDKMYKVYNLKRVFYSAYVPVNKDNLLPMLASPPLKRENRLYQVDWLLRFYKFKINDLIDEKNPNLNLLLDPKITWALRNLERFPKEINTCSFDELLRIPGVGVKGAKKIYSSRKYFKITFKDLKNMNIVLKRAKYFILCNGKYYTSESMFKKEIIEKCLILEDLKEKRQNIKQLCLFND